MDILLPIANYPQFILNRYKEESQKASHLATPKKNIMANMKKISLYSTKSHQNVKISLTVLGTKSITKKQMTSRNIRSRQDSNQVPRSPKANTITIERKRILSNAVAGYCI